MTVTIYHNPRCSKSRETLKLLQDRGLVPQIIDYLKTPPALTDLEAIAAGLNQPVTALLRKKEGAEAGLSASMSPADLLAGLAAHPAALERPIVLCNGHARLGRPPEAVLEILGQAV